MALSLATEAQYIKGVGPRLAALLAERGIVCVEDLVTTLPFRYEDRTRQAAIQDLLEGETATVVAQVRTLKTIRTRRGMEMLEATVGDGSGVMRCVWYNAEYLRDRFQSGRTLALYGKVERENGRPVMRQPEFEPLGAAEALAGSLKLGRIVPVYEAIGALTSGRLRRLVHRALSELPEELPEPLPAEMRTRLRLPPRRQALEQVHFPAQDANLEEYQKARSAGHVRLILEELFFLQAGLELKRRRVKRQPGPAMAVNAHLRERLKQLLPFHPTAEQKQALKEIVADMCGGAPMRRLLQGDVGSGKTIVALEAAAIAIENGYQAALMAPTQILAEQHYYYARERLPGYTVRLATGAQRRRDGVAEAQLVVGTQALLEGGMQLPRLGLVVVDEQHRFGVLQRYQLMRKAGAAGSPELRPSPHVLVMTATPIPRTLALALYGDLDTSTLRQAPPGAMAIRTHAVAEARSGDVYEYARRRIERGRQAYFVYPAIDESAAIEVKAAVAMQERLQRAYPQLRLALLHGRLPAEQKQNTMRQFREGKIQALVATTVIEVGLDVPNATIMVIEHAERFGIAQLHQLRGRVGRPGAKAAKGEQAHCFLVYGEGAGETARRRLAALEKSRDGFELAEVDLKLRGPGEFFGTRQSGLPALTVAQPLRDQPLMELAREEARAFLDRAGEEEQRRLVQQIQARWQRRYGLVEVG
jgi:ATP-dependent DNA helicase RecG